jgi:hypothetical protein
MGQRVNQPLEKHRYFDIESGAPKAVVSASSNLSVTLCFPFLLF